MTDSKKLKFTDTEIQSLKAKETKVYLQSVMQKVFRNKWEEYLEKLLAGDRKVLDLCANQHTKNLDFFPLLHTLCLITGRKDDLDEKDPARAADRWLTWYSENRDRLAWSKESETWNAGVSSPHDEAKP